uniref:Uncharacterized protein n=1 Tax=Pararge aegeria TaxID=116150 RepID=S4PGH9_9NEOP
MDFLKQLKSITWCKPNWAYLSVTKETNEFLTKCKELQKPDPFDDVEEIIKKSDAFPIKFPIDTVRLVQLKSKRPIERLKKNIVSTYPLIHERVLILMTRFLTYKKQFGSNIEKDFYKEMTVQQFIERILKKRAASFYGPSDKYLLLTGETGASGWELVGSSEQKEPLLLENCLSYDELKLSAMVYVSGYTDCINDGNRKNSGVVKDDDIEDNAVIIGLIGPRVKRRGKMDHEDIIVTRDQNIQEHGYGFANKPHQRNKLLWRRMWCEFYENENVTYEKATILIDKQNKYESRPYIDRYQYKKRYKKVIFDNESYYKRICVLAESTLLEAEYRAVESEKYAFVNVIGCGLGVWIMLPHQGDVYVLTFLERIHSLLQENMLNHISDVNFAYVNVSSGIEGLFTVDTEHKEIPLRKLFIEYDGHPKGGINVQMHNREPSSKLSGDHAGKLLVMTYPWDSNAHPGNEFWCGLLASTGDSAAASSTQIAELHNAHINPAVSADNVRVVGRHGLKTLSEYCHDLTTSN